MSDPVSLLDYSDLECCGQPVAPAVRFAYDSHPGVEGYACACGSFISRTAFLQNSHGTRSQRRARIEAMREA